MCRLETIFTAGLLLAASPLYAAGLQAELSANQVAEGESVQLRLSGEAAILTAAPDLSPLSADFNVLGTEQSQQVQIINGTRSDKLAWIVTLQPHGKGHLTIPSIYAGAASSAPISLDVVSAKSLPPDQARSMPTVLATVPDGAIYEQQEIPLTLTITVPEGLQGGQIETPESPDFILSTAGQDETSQTLKGGKSVTIVKRHYTLRPQKSGNLVIGPFKLRGTLQDAAQTGFGADPFTQMMLGGAFGGQMFQQGKPIEVQSDALTLTIKAAPSDNAGEWFLPAKRVELSAVWDPSQPSFKVGESVMRRVQLKALGASEVQLPDLPLPQVAGAKIYPDKDASRSQNTDEGTAALREFSYSILPTISGKITLPEIRVKWFNTVSDKAEMAIVPAEVIDVAKGADFAPPPAEPKVIAKATALEKPLDHSLQWGMLVDAAAAILGVLGCVFIWRGRPIAKKTLRQDPFTALQSAVATGRKAEVATAAQTWMRARSASLGGIEPVFAAAPNLKPVWEAMEGQLYGGTESDWTPKALLQAANRAEKGLRAALRQKRVAALPALYPVNDKIVIDIGSRHPAN